MIKRLLYEFVEDFLRYKNGLVGKKLRYIYYKKRLGSCGSNVKIDCGVYIESPNDVFIGNNVWIDKNVIILGGRPNQKRKIFYKNIEQNSEEIGKVKLGHNIHIAPNVVIQGHGGVTIGSNSGIASGTKIYSFSHHYRDLNNNDQKKYFFSPMVENDKQSMILSPIRIGFGCAIGLNCVILPGCIIDDFSWIGSGVVIQNKVVKENMILLNKQEIIEKNI